LPFRGSSERSEALRGKVFSPSIDPLDTQRALKIENLMKSVPISVEFFKLTYWLIGLLRGGRDHFSSSSRVARASRRTFLTQGSFRESTVAGELRA